MNKEKTIYILLMLADNYACAEKELTRALDKNRPYIEVKKAYAMAILERSALEKELRKVL